ncbi:MAG: preprotein translocase subunit SecE [bacterium]|nr:preprotein translocase subunit SecE [bacterium]
MAGSSSSARSKARRGRTDKSQTQVKASDTLAQGGKEATSNKKLTNLHETTGLRGLYDKVVRFLVSVKDEMGRVTWPTGGELRVSTIVVMFTLILVALYMGLVDVACSWVFGTPKI